MKAFGIMLSTTLLLTGAAQAADLGWNSGASPIYSPTPATGWTGFYAGVNAGYGWGSLERRPTAGPTVENNSDGWQAGGQVGYNMDMGGFVVGAEADLQWSNIGYTEDLPGFGTFESGMDVYGTVRGRAGVTFGPVMPFVTAGFAAGRGSASVTNSATNVVTSQSANHVGWTIGGGLEAQATENISFKAEYLYVNLGSQAYNGLPTGNTDVTQNFSVIRAGMNYKF